MKKHLFTLSLCLFAISAWAQTPTPTPVTGAGSIYLDATKTPAARLADARAFLALQTDPSMVASVTSEIDFLTLAFPTSWTAIQPLAEGLIASNGAYCTGTVAATAATYTQSRQDYLFGLAVQQKGNMAFSTVDTKLAFLLSIFDALPDNASPALVQTINNNYLMFVNAKTLDYMGQGNYTAALNNALQPQLLNSPYSAATIQNILKIKTITHAADVLSWAKVVYVMGDFSHSSANSVLVGNAFRASANLAAENSFIASQTDSTVTCALTTVPFPTAFAGGTLPEPQYAGINILLRGDAKGALAWARAGYDAAETNGALNVWADRVACGLRNYYFNLSRANQFVVSNQTPAAGQPTPAPFVFTELQ